MRKEYYVAYANEISRKIAEFIIKKILHKLIICQAIAKRNLYGDSISVFGVTAVCHIRINKGEKFLVFDTEGNRNFKLYFPKILGLRAYLMEEIICQTKWKGQPYKFYFKDINQ